ncbi:MAG: XRE family transcriptional regulator [Chloroflexi bacterium]|nr:XRE family transcriptional regulator [Chloroflexota bacterium]
MTEKQKPEGQTRFEAYWAKQMADPAFRAIYEEEAAKKEVWLQLVEARQSAGLTQQQMAERLGVSQAQVARIEKRGYDAYTLNTLRRYVAALGEGFGLEVTIRTPDDAAPVSAPAGTR